MNFEHLNIIENIDKDEIGDTVESFLKFLCKPSCIILNGEDNKRCRAFVTLLHGNEPSGVMALYRWIKSGKKPNVRIICIVASVKTALEPPLFHYRKLPGNKDLNRCFKSPFTTKEEKIAEEILNILHKHSPEAVIDMHNTSGSSPAFGVATHYDRKHELLTYPFSHKLVITHLRLGALMDMSEDFWPTVTIEVGGRLDKEAHELAWVTINYYFMHFNILSDVQTPHIELMIEPVRIELKKGTTLCYATTANTEFDVTLNKDIEYFNFKNITPDQQLGWVNHKALDNFLVNDARHNSCISDWLKIVDRRLYPVDDCILFMVTNNPVIAIEDCLFYIVKKPSYNGSKHLS